MKKGVDYLDTIPSNELIDRFFNRRTQLDLPDDKFIEPYGFKIYNTDTINSIKIKRVYKWLLEDLMLNGNCKIYNKKQKKFENYIILEDIHAHFGHGGKDLLLPDKTLFFNLTEYTDVFYDSDYYDTIDYWE